MTREYCPICKPKPCVGHKKTFTPLHGMAGKEPVVNGVVRDDYRVVTTPFQQYIEFDNMTYADACNLHIREKS